MQKLITGVRVYLVFAVLLGLVYPLFMLLIGQLIFPHQANGSLITHHGKIIGSSLIAQEFTAPQYFHSRFSATNYDAMNSGGSNLAASNAQLYTQIEKHVERVKLENDLSEHTELPADMVLTSASGLDPHITLANALLQLPRIAKYRGLMPEKVKKLICDHLDHNYVGIWGQAGVNVLQLNLALDKLRE